MGLTVFLSSDYATLIWSVIAILTIFLPAKKVPSND